MRAADRTLSDLSRFIINSLTPGGGEGFLKSLSPESLIISSITLTITSVIIQNLYALVLLTSTSVLLAVILGVNLRSFLIRAYGFIPAFTALISLPAIFSFITPGNPLLILNTPFGILCVTHEGFKAVSTLILRVTASVSYLTLLTLKYDINRLTEGLRRLRAPNQFINILHFMLRYSLTLSRCLMNMIMAREARELGYEGIVEYWRRWGEGLGALQLKALNISESVYMALQARGYGLGRDSRKLKLSINPVLTFLTALLLGAAVTVSLVTH